MHGKIYRMFLLLFRHVPGDFPQKGSPMTALFDKLILFIFCAVFYLMNFHGTYTVVLIILAVIFTSLASYFDNETADFAVFCAAVLVGTFFPGTAYFLPLFVYGIFTGKWQWFAVLSMLPVIWLTINGQGTSSLFILLVIILSCVLRMKSIRAEKKLRAYNDLRDDIVEKQMQLEEANRDLLEKQDYEVHLATLKERNRISAELHDSIGHVLTNSLLQTGALIASCRDEDAKESLKVLRNSLSGGLDEVRASIHNLHDDSVDLYDEVQKEVGEFLFCPVSLRCQIDTPPDKKIRYAFLSILKEGLANIARHSNATEASVILMEHPALYQLIIRDNGTNSDAGKNTGIIPVDLSCDSDGMGLPGMKKRIDGLGGNIAFRRNPGFEIFVSVPKEKP